MGETLMPEFLQKAIEKAKARPDKLKKNLEELGSLKEGENRLAKVVGEGYGKLEPNSDSNAAFKEAGKRGATLMEDGDVQSAVMVEAHEENRQKEAKKESEKLKEERRRGAVELKDVLERMGLFQKVSVNPPEYSENDAYAQVEVTMKPEKEYEAVVSQEKRDGWEYRVGSLLGGDQLSGKKIESYGNMMYLLAHFMREYNIPYLELKIKGHAGDGSEIKECRYLGAPKGEERGEFPFSQGWQEERKRARENERWLRDEEMRKALEEKKTKEKGGEAKPDET